MFLFEIPVKINALKPFNPKIEAKREKRTIFSCLSFLSPPTSISCLGQARAPSLSYPGCCPKPHAWCWEPDSGEGSWGAHDAPTFKAQPLRLTRCRGDGAAYSWPGGHGRFPHVGQPVDVRGRPTEIRPQDDLACLLCPGQPAPRRARAWALRVRELALPQPFVPLGQLLGN